MTDKLVRDLIPEIIKKSGKTPVSYKAEEEEYRVRLNEKLTEEVEELQSAVNNNNLVNIQEEMCDVLEVIAAMVKTYGIDSEKLFEQADAKRKERGGFTGQVVLQEVR